MQQSALVITSSTDPASSRWQALHHYKGKIRGCLAVPGQVPVALVELGRWAVAVRDEQLYKLEGARDIYSWMYRQFKVRETQCKKVLCIGEQLSPEEIAPLIGARKLGLEMLYQLALLERELRPLVYARLHKVRSVAALLWAREQAEAVRAAGGEEEAVAARLREALGSGRPPQDPRLELRAQLQRLRALVARLQEAGQAGAAQIAAMEQAVALLERQLEELEPPRGEVSFPAVADEAAPRAEVSFPAVAEATVLEAAVVEVPAMPPAAPVIIEPRTWLWLARSYAPPPPPALPRELVEEHPLSWCDQILPAVVDGVLDPRVYRVASLLLTARLALWRMSPAARPLMLDVPPADMPEELRGEQRTWQMLLREGSVLLEAGHRDVARVKLQRALRMAEVMEGDASAAVADPLVALAEHASQDGDFRAAAAYIRRALPSLAERGYAAADIARYREYVLSVEAYEARGG